MRGKAGIFCRVQGFIPTQIPGITGWWDASDTNTLFDADTGGGAVAADGQIGRIEDKSGAGRTFSQVTSGYRPIRKAAAKNSLDVVRFDGSDDRLDGTFQWSGIVAASAYTMLAVAKCSAASFDDDTDPVNNEFIISESSGGYGAFYFRSSNLVGAMGFPEPPGTTPDFADTAYTVGTWAVFTQTWDGTNLSIRVNGGTPASVASDDLYDFNTSVYLGRQSYADTFFEGDLGELLTYNVALSTGDREALESYLADKWGIS